MDIIPASVFMMALTQFRMAGGKDKASFQQDGIMHLPPDLPEEIHIFPEGADQI
jgi:hypothetical protein